MQNLANFAYLEEFFFKILFIHLFFCWIFVATHRFSLVAVSRGCSLAEVGGLVLASLVAERGL